MQDVWPRLAAVSRLRFASQSGAGSQTGWNHQGSGRVQVSVRGQSIEFAEEFVLDNGRRCRDVKRWRAEADGLYFDHWRLGAFVPLFALVRTENGLYCSQRDYVCLPDAYSGSLKVETAQLVLRLEVQGPRKNEQMVYVYTAA